MNHVHIGVFAALTMVALLDSLSAQQVRLAVGQRVRVTIPSAGIEKQEASVLALRGDSIALSVEAPSDLVHLVVKTRAQVAVPLDSLASLEIAVGRRTRAWALGALGGGIGCLLGAVTYKAPASPPSFVLPDFGHPGPILLRGLVGGLAGFGIGALIGSQLHAAVWEAVSRDQIHTLRMSVTALPSGHLGLGASLAF